PFTLKQEKFYLTASTGITLYPADGSSIDTLLKNADLAAEAGQQHGTHHYQFFTSALNARTADQMAIEACLHEALAQSEFQLYYQPQVNLQTGKISGVEALLRWQQPERGMISPAIFIPLAEATGLIIPIGEWVLQTACQQAQAWHLEGLPPIQVAVNLSTRQFNQPDLSQLIARVLQETGLAPAWLELEITESCVMQNPEAAIATLNDLKALGVHISMDDFGTGYSSLNYLQQFPFDTLKIDQCFVRNLDTNPKNQVIVGAVTQMAHDLDLTVIAEGVETAAELSCLKQYHCDQVQGYLFSRPQPPTAFAALLATEKHL
ncbi:MAG: GGDEF domain-containing phosphodiesterase, partial [Kovacikia sp.]